MRKLLAIVALGLTSAPAMAADLGGRSYKDNNIETVVPGMTANWTGLYIGAGLSHNSTTHDVKGQQDDSSAKFLKDTKYTNRDLCKTAGAAVAADVYKVKPTGGCATGSALVPSGSVVEGDAFPKDSTSTALKDAPFPTGEMGNSLLANGGSNVGYTVDTTSFFTQSPTAKGWAPSLMIGYDKQVSSMLFGVMADYQFRNAKTNFGDVNVGDRHINGLSVSQSDAFFLGARAGFLPTQRVLVYGLAGYTWLNHSGAEDDLRSVDTIGDKNYTKHDASYSDGSYGGWSLGAGLETIVMPNVRVGLEARQTWYGKETLMNSTFTDPINHAKVSTNVTDEPTETTVMGTIKFNLTGDSSPFK